MVEEIKEHIYYENKIKILNMITKSVITDDGDQFRVDVIINTVPWDTFGLDDSSFEILGKSINELKHN